MGRENEEIQDRITYKTRFRVVQRVSTSKGKGLQQHKDVKTIILDMIE